ncbi:MAG: hypothetical protein ABIQ62_10050, partial [Thermomonas sp.]
MQPLKVSLLIVLCAWPTASLAATSAMRPSLIEPTHTRAAAFDASFLKIVGPASLDDTRDAYEANLERLRALLPPGDRVREVRLHS